MQGWRRVSLACLLLLALAGIPPQAHTAPQHQHAPQVQENRWILDTVVDWQAGTLDDLLIANNEGGELRLDAGQTAGVFVSRPYSATFALNAVGAFWRAKLPPGTQVALELRGRTTPPPPPDSDTPDTGWSDWQPLIAADARSKAEDGAFAAPDVLVFAPDTRYLQVRISFTSSVPNASAVLDRLTIAYLNTTQGPTGGAGLPRTPMLSGPQTLTPRPMMVQRSTWAAARRAARSNYALPRGIIIHQVDVPGGITDTPALLRALAHYQTDVLGWEDMAYHYLIDETGTLYEGRLGGPTADTPDLSGGDTAVHVALVGSRSATPGPAARGMLTHLLAWLCQAYGIVPTGQHEVKTGTGSTTASYPTLLGHNDIVPEAPDPGAPLHDILEQIRTTVDQSVVRSRWYFPEGNVADYREELVFFNPGSDDTDADITLITDAGGTPIKQVMTVPAGSHATLVVNHVISDTASMSVIVESNRPLIAERSMDLPGDINISPGIQELSRVWYFAEGSTADTFRTYLVLLNPNDTVADATITYMKGDGTQAVQQAVLPARERVVVSIHDFMPGVGFGMRVVANRPIAAERTMRFGPNGGGMHIGRGASTLSRHWYFAEGTTDPPFTMRLLLLNPNERACNTTVTFMTPDGTSLKRNYAIPPTTRLVVDVNEVVPAIGVATTVEADRPLAAERALYFDPQKLALQPLEESTAITRSEVLTTTDKLPPETRIPMAGTVSFGATSPAYTWSFADGRTQGAREYILLTNPSRGQARVTFDMVLADGSAASRDIVMPAGSRYTLAVHDFYPDQNTLAITVRATQPVVAERSIFAANGSSGGSTSPGVAGP